MNNGDKVSVTIHPSVNDPGRAGSLTHTYSQHALTCWSYHKTLIEKCHASYVCNHKDGTHPASRDKVTISVSTNKDFAKLKGKINPKDVYGKIQYSNSGMCDESWTEIPGSCMIKFKCHGNKKNTTPAMAAGLKTIGEKVVKHETVKENTKLDPCKSGKDICIPGWISEDVNYTWLPQTLTISVSDANSADQGELSYEIDCSHGPQCDICKAMKAGLGLGAALASVMAPSLGQTANVLAQSINIKCAIAGC
ncbi:hypothetical protein CC78DRAFT_584257 [Lojkania enalia]|uniref:Uncharacterized protein n=1 Tax=Lojkania enalia TaxID=147567 RepID=A0A9P4MX32_9PLEO|nr:hypothetical protein CC78DRAFT_584257 [Didymosphaeria enalia]